MGVKLTRRNLLTFAAAAAGVAALPAASVSALAAPATHRLHTHRRHRLFEAVFRPRRHRGHGIAETPALPYARPITAERRIAFFNMHTNESLDLVYWREGYYQPAAMRAIEIFMRDWRAGETHPIDPALLDLLTDLHRTTGTSEPFTLVSGYRSPRTNAMLASLSGGVATNSMHLQGRAADVQLSDRSLTTLHNAALRLAEGGVGYYPRSDFVHVDTGRVRRWSFG